MHRLCKVIILFGLALSTQHVSAQTFEAASIRHRTDNTGPTETKIEPGGRFVAVNAPLKVLILFAYQYMPWQVSGGSDWVNYASYDIQAKPETSASVEQVRAMLRNLLSDRFALRTTTASRTLPVYVLAVDRRGSRLRPSRDGGVPQIMRGPAGQSVFRNAPISQLVNFLALRLSRNVIDETELRGLLISILRGHRICHRVMSEAMPRTLRTLTVRPFSPPYAISWA